MVIKFMNSTSWPPKIAICVGAVVLREQKVLLIREAKGNDHGVWGIPWGFVEGKTADGTLDTPEVAAVRETVEEAKVQTRIVGLLGIQNHMSHAGDPRLYLIFLGEHISGEPEPDGVETDRAAYLSLDELNAWHEPVDDFVKWVVTRVLTGEAMIIPPQVINPYSPFLGFF